MTDKCSFCQQEVKKGIWDNYAPFYRIWNQEIQQNSFICSSCWDKNKEKFKQKKVSVWYKKGNGQDSYDYHWKELQGKCEASYLGKDGCQNKNMAYATYWTANTGIPENQLTCVHCLKFLLKKDIIELEKNSPFTPEQEEIYNQKKQKLAELLRDNPNDNDDNNEDDEEKKQERLALEKAIDQRQTILKVLEKAGKGYPGYSEYNIQKIKELLAKDKEKYKAKFGELPISLRDNNDIPTERERERERESKFTFWDTAIRSHC